jgi:hypothetical protein
MSPVEIIVPIFGMLVPITLFIAVFSYLAYASKAENQRREEEARARYDFLKKMAEGGNFDVQKFIEYEQAEQLMRRRRRAESLTLAAFILAGFGVAVGAFLYVVDPVFNGGLSTIGLLPLLLGAALYGAAALLQRGSKEAAKG